MIGRIAEAVIATACYGVMTLYILWPVAGDHHSAPILAILGTLNLCTAFSRKQPA